MPHAYTEDQLVEQPVIGLLTKPGSETVSPILRGELPRIPFVTREFRQDEQHGQDETGWKKMPTL